MNGNQNANVKKRSLSGQRKTAIIVFSALAVLLVAAIIAANYLVKIKKVTLDGTNYIVKPINGQYSMFRENGEKLETTSDGYYVLDSGSLAALDRDSGNAEIYTRIDTSGTEALSSDGWILIFEYLERNDISSISVKNENGEYSFSGVKQGDTVTFTLDGYPDAFYSGETLSELFACAGYTKAMRIDKEISLDLYGYEEYGLDESPTAEYTVKTFDGAEHTVWIGDKTPDGNGYYVRYKSDDRYALYILTATDYIEDTLLSPVENMVKTVLNLTYNGSGTTSLSTDYIDVQNCKLTHYTYDTDGKATGKVYAYFSYFSFLPDGSKRLDGEYKAQPFVGHGDMEAYIPSVNSINEMLYNLNNLTFIGTCHLGTEKEALKKYGLDKPSAVLEFDHTDDSDKDYIKKDRQTIYFSEKTESGTYYAYARVERNGEVLASYDQIVEIDAAMLDFLSYGKQSWVEPYYFSLYSEFCSRIDITKGSETYTFVLNHEKETVNGKEQSVETVTLNYGSKSIVLSNESASYYDSEGNKQTVKGSHSVFRSMYTMLQTSSVMGEHGLSDEEKKSYMTNENDILTIKITTTSGRIMTFRYYRMSDTRSLLCAKTENSPFAYTGNPESSDFYALTGRAEKIWDDVRQVMRAAELFAAGKYEEYSEITISDK